MKRCPECRRDYYDETLMYCLDDGNALLDGPATLGADEPATAILRGSDPPSESPTRAQINATNETALLQSGIVPRPASSAEYLVNQAKSHMVQLAIASVLILLAVGGGWLAFRRFGGSTEKKLVAIPFQNVRMSALPDWNNGMRPSLSLDAKYIAFGLEDGGGRYSLNLRQLGTGGTSQIVPPQPGQIFDPRFSPDGNYIYYVYVAANQAQGKLFRIPLLGGGTPPREVLNDIDGPVSFSPDGRRFAFLRHNSAESYDSIMIAEVDGAERPLLTSVNAGYTGLKNPAWSPDGAKIVATSSRQGPEGREDGLLEISVADGTSKPIGIKKFPGIHMAQWVSDGSGLIFSAWDNASAPSQLWYASYPDGETRQITNDANEYSLFSFSADNRTLIVTKEEYRSSISSIRPDTKETLQIVPEFRAITPTYSNLTLAPNGKIIFVKPKEGDIGNLWTVDADGRNAQGISSDMEIIYFPVVSPNSSSIVFSSKQSGSNSLWRTDINGNNPVQLTNDPEVTDSLSQITPDGQTIVFQRTNRSEGKVSIMRMTIDGKNGQPVVGDEPSTKTKRFQLSPDGKRIAIYTVDAVASKGYLSIFSFDGNAFGTREKEIETNLDFGRFRWTPDGKAITYINRNSSENLLQMDLDRTAATPKQLTNFGSGQISDFIWSSDSKRLFVIHSVKNTDVIIIKDPAPAAKN